MLSWDGDCRRIEHDKLSDPIILSFLKPEDRHTQPIDNQETGQRCPHENEKVSGGKLRKQAEDLTPKNEKLLDSLTRMSRSNTISFIAENSPAMDEFR